MKQAPKGTLGRPPRSKASYANELSRLRRKLEERERDVTALIDQVAHFYDQIYSPSLRTRIKFLLKGRI